MVNIGTYFSSPALEQQKLYQDQILSLKKHSKLGFIEWALFLTPGYIIEYFGGYVNQEAIDSRNIATQRGSIATVRNYKEILHAIADGLESKSNLPAEIILPFVTFVKNNPNLNLLDNKGREANEEKTISDNIKEQCYALLMRFLKHLESRYRRNRRKMLRRTAGAIGLSALGRGFSNIHHLRKPYEHTLTEGVPEVLDGYVIINVSDIHIHEDNDFNLNEFSNFEAYFKRIKKHLIEKLGIDESKIILVMPGDFLTQRNRLTEQTNWAYAQTILPLLNILPGKYRFVTFGNHDERHDNITDLRQWFEESNYISLDELGGKNSYSIPFTNGEQLQVLGIPDFLTREDITAESLQDIVDKTKQAIFNIILVHNLDAIDPHLPGGLSDQTIKNTYIATGHTHWFHARLPIIGTIINSLMLHFKSKYYQGRYQLVDNVHIDNCPGLNNSPIAPFRMRADPGATITFLKHKPT